LFLGGKGSGKTTIMKQLNILYGDGPGCGIGDEERERCRPVIYEMLDGAVKRLIEAYDELELRVEEHHLEVRVIS
jgi:hypothetical protein